MTAARVGRRRRVPCPERADRRANVPVLAVGVILRAAEGPHVVQGPDDRLLDATDVGDGEHLALHRMPRQNRRKVAAVLACNADDECFFLTHGLQCSEKRFHVAQLIGSTQPIKKLCWCFP